MNYIKNHPKNSICRISNKMSFIYVKLANDSQITAESMFNAIKNVHNTDNNSGKLIIANARILMS